MPRRLSRRYAKKHSTNIWGKPLVAIQSKAQKPKIKTTPVIKIKQPIRTYKHKQKSIPKSKRSIDYTFSRPSDKIVIRLAREKQKQDLLDEFKKIQEFESFVKTQPKGAFDVSSRDDYERWKKKPQQDYYVVYKANMGYSYKEWEKVRLGGKYKSFESAKKGLLRHIKQHQKMPATFHSSVGVQTREAEKLAIGTRINRIDYLVTKPKTAHPDYSKVQYH